MTFDLFMHCQVDLCAEAWDQQAQLTDHYEAVGALFCKVVFMCCDELVLAAGCFILSGERKT